MVGCGSFRLVREQAMRGVERAVEQVDAMHAGKARAEGSEGGNERLKGKQYTGRVQECTDADVSEALGKYMRATAKTQPVRQ